MSPELLALVQSLAETLALALVAGALVVLAQVRKRVTEALKAAREAYRAASQGHDAAATAARASIAAHDTATQAVEQVRNSHTTNLRDDIDKLSEAVGETRLELARVHTRLDAISELATDAHRTATEQQTRPFWRRHLD